MKAKKVVKSRVAKTRAGGTMSEAVYWTFIRSALRQKSRWWPPVTQVKLEARRIYKGVNKRQKYEYQCNICKEWFMEKDINIDHIIPAGALNCGADLEGFVGRLFVEVEGLQVLCINCHDKKTQKDRKK
jgi:5-methylcytosine-specific restriction endonuclease McrA